MFGLKIQSRCSKGALRCATGMGVTRGYSPVSKLPAGRPTIRRLYSALASPSYTRHGARSRSAIFGRELAAAVFGSPAGGQVRRSGSTFELWRSGAHRRVERAALQLVQILPTVRPDALVLGR
jgi:hypothetical protein